MRYLSVLLVISSLFVAVSPLHAVEKEEIDKAIERGVAGLRALQSADGSWSQRKGMTALAGVTLLECDVPPSDTAIQKAAEIVRKEAILTQDTYPIATAIIFLDRLGEAVDIPLLEVLTVRLLAAQMENGGWGYYGPGVPEDEKQRLQEHYKNAKDKKPEPRKGPRTVRDLAPEVQRRLIQIAAKPPSNFATADNSNTQFATLALWLGRRQGVPVDVALARIDFRFRNAQNADGGWGYTSPGAVTTPSMTCAGVLGLSVAHGLILTTGKPLGANARQTLDPVRDANLRAALHRLALQVDQPPSVKKVTPPKLKDNDIYFLWSLERIMVAMDMERLDKKDWYSWGAEILLANQQSDGRWNAEYGAIGADTCFALLFLRRANLAGDLTALLRNKEFILKASGTIDREPKPPIDPKKPPVDPKDPKKPPVETTSPKLAVETRPTFTQSKSAEWSEKLLKATSAERGTIITQIRDGKGVEYTEALAGAIPQMSGESKRQAREALAERLTRMKAESLARYLQDDDSEIRRAAALASGTREMKDHVPQLIDLLGDSDQGVVLAAHTALKAMTGQKIGAYPAPWRTWWKQQEKK